MKRHYIGKSIIMLFSLFFLLSCPNPISEDVLLHIKDTLGPSIVITSPADGSFCAKTVVVTGTVSDVSTDDGATGEVRSFAYEIRSTDIAEEIIFDEEGSFSFDFSTTSLGSTFVLKVTAEDWNGNIGVVSITLNILEGNDIPSFETQSENHKVTLTWKNVPSVVSYSLYYTTNGTLPSEQYSEIIANVISPFTLSGLENGALCVFRLRALSGSGEDNWSGYEKAIPLYHTTLTPVVFGEYKQNRITWPEIPGSNEFIVYKAEQAAGVFEDFTGTVVGNEFVDTSVELGRNYWYKVRPAEYSDVLSGVDCGTPCPFRENRLVGSLHFQSTWGVAVSGNYAFIADYSTGLNIIDISNPENPVLVKTVATSDPKSVAVSGNYAYVADFYDGLVVVDISTPSNASIVHTISMGGVGSKDVDISGDYAFVSNSNAGELYIVDINDTYTPETAEIIYTVTDDVSGPSSVCVLGDYAYLADATDGLRILDITSLPGSIPVVIQTVTTDITYAVNVDVNSGYAFVADYSAGNIRVVDLSPLPLLEPSVIQSVPITGTITCVAVNENYAYVAAYGGGGFSILDLAPLPADAPSVIHTVNTSYARDVALRGDYAYVADGMGGFRIIDIITPADISLVKTLALGNVQHVEVSGEYCYASHSDGFSVVDISEPENASEVKYVALDGWANCVDVSGNCAYVPLDGPGMQIVDITDPENPSVMTYSVLVSEGYGVTVFGSYAYVGDGEAGIKVVDLTQNGSAPIILSIPTSGHVYNTAIYGNYAVTTASWTGYVVTDITEPENASILHETDFSDLNNAIGIARCANYLLIADKSSPAADPRNGGFHVLDLSPLPAGEPSHLHTINWRLENGSFALDAWDVDVSGTYAYVADNTNGLIVLDLSPLPADPPEIIRTIPTTDAESVEISGNYLYLADGSGGLKIYKLWDFQ